MLISQSRDEISLSIFFAKQKKIVFVSDRYVVITVKKINLRIAGFNCR